LTKIRSPPLTGRCLRADQAEDDHGNAYSADGARDLADRAQGGRIVRPRYHAHHRQENRLAVPSSTTPTMIKRQFLFRI
jgi:hypothetical protein